MVKIDQILTLDVVDIGIFDGPAIRRVAAVNDVAEFALRDSIRDRRCGARFRCAICVFARSTLSWRNSGEVSKSRKSAST